MKKGMTLIELLVTVMIISIVVMVALPSFHTMQEASLNREAWSVLKRMQEAARLHNMEFTTGTTPVWYPPTGTGLITTTTAAGRNNINQNLRLSLPETNTNWIYGIKDENAPSVGTCVQAVRNGDDGRAWSLEIGDNADDLDHNPDSYDDPCP